jgi:arginine N-succinyltransferase
MLLIRPIALDDLPALEALCHRTGYGLTSLPRDARLLGRRIRSSIDAFNRLADNNPPRGENYLFVLVRTETGEVIGTSGIVSKVGGFEPFYGYRIESHLHASPQLKVRKQIASLHLTEQHDGPCEIGSLFLSPDHRGGGAGRLLSLCRFLFIADHPDYFDPMVIAEMRGVIDETGRSPFWDAIGHHFFDIDFPTADYLSVVNKKFIADLMPDHPIYIPLLPYSAQAVIGKVQPDTEPALAMLEDEGFVRSGVIDIFDAGPVVQCRLDRIRSVRQSTVATVAETGAVDPANPPVVIATRRESFRATIAGVDIVPSGVRLEAAVADSLGVATGDSIRFVSLKPVPENQAHDAPGSL